MFAKLENGALVSAPKYYETTEGQLFTNDPLVHLSHEYRKVVVTDEPYAQDGYIPVCCWQQTDNEIVQVWQFQSEEADYE